MVLSGCHYRLSLHYKLSLLNISIVFFAAMGNRQALWPFLVAETNKYFQWHLTKLVRVLQKSSKMHLWKPLTVEKLRAFLGLLLNMGLLRKHNIEEYWNTTNYS